MNRLTEKEMKGFTYILWWPNTGKRYYGVRYARNCRTADIGTKYFSSSRRVKEYWKIHGKPIIIIDMMFSNIHDAREYENWMLIDNDVKNQCDWLNLNDRQAPPIIQGEHHHMKRLEFRNRMSGDNHPMKGKKHSIETKKKISDNLKGRAAWNKGVTHCAGLDNAAADKRLHLFKNTALDLEVVCTKFDLKRIYGRDLKVSEISLGHRKSTKGWTYHGLFE